MSCSAPYAFPKLPAASRLFVAHGITLQTGFNGPPGQQRAWASGYYGGIQPGTPNQPGQADQGTGEVPEEDPGKANTGSTVFKMFESAATTFASLTILGYVLHVIFFLDRDSDTHALKACWLRLSQVL